MEPVGRINLYKCKKCGEKHVTFNRDDGVTPFMISCRRTNCDGMAESSFYRADQSLTPMWEWYKPNDEELDSLSPEWRDHIEMGGLKLRAIGEKWNQNIRGSDHGD